MMHHLAIVGYGGMGGWHAENIKAKVPSIQVKGAYDIREEVWPKIQEDGLHLYKSWQEILADPEIDIVTVATPNNFHKSLVIQALEAGKNVVCEKPVAMNAAEVEEMMAVAKRTGKLFSVHQNRRWDKDYRMVCQSIGDGPLGKPYFIESRVQGSRGVLHAWRGCKLNGGGMLLDWGVHLIDQLCMMLDGPVVGVEAHLVSVFTPEVDDSLKLMLRFAGDVSALIEVSTNCFITLPRWHVSGEKGTLIIEDFSCKGKIVQLKPDAEVEWSDIIVYTEAGPTRTMAPRPTDSTIQLELPQVEVDWTEYYGNIVDVLDNGAELLVKPEEALRVMKIIDLLFESARVGHGLSCHL